MKKIDEKEAEQIFERRKPKPDDEVVGRALTLRGEIDTTPQPLRKLRSFEGACLRVPMDIPPESQIVLKLLFDCFTRHGHVSEGLIGDMMWGFENAMPPIPKALTWNGLKQLEAFGYLKFRAPDGSYIEPSSDQIESAWVVYTPKILNMVYEDLGEVKGMQ
jgi:hypothetical protein